MMEKNEKNIINFDEYKYLYFFYGDTVQLIFDYDIIYRQQDSRFYKKIPTRTFHDTNLVNTQFKMYATNIEASEIYEYIKLSTTLVNYVDEVCLIQLELTQLNKKDLQKVQMLFEEKIYPNVVLERYIYDNKLFLHNSLEKYTMYIKDEAQFDEDKLNIPLNEAHSLDDIFQWNYVEANGFLKNKSELDAIREYNKNKYAINIKINDNSYRILLDKFDTLDEINLDYSDNEKIYQIVDLQDDDKIKYLVLSKNIDRVKLNQHLTNGTKGLRLLLNNYNNIRLNEQAIATDYENFEAGVKFNFEPEYYNGLLDLLQKQLNKLEDIIIFEFHLNDSEYNILQNTGELLLYINNIDLNSDDE